MATGLIDIKQHAQALNQARNAPWSAPVKQALEQTQDNFNQLSQRIASLEAVVSGLNLSVNVLRQGIIPKTFFVTAPFTIPIPQEPTNTIFIYVFEQDATGGHAITIPTEWKGFFPIPTTASTVSSYGVFRSSLNLFIPVLGGQGDVLQT